jgi:Tol biopolymer transport system component
VDSGYQGAPAWSPNSKSIAYVAQVDGILQVFTRTLGQTLPFRVTRTIFDCLDPFWSPDGKHLYFHSQAHDKLGLWVVSAAGGEPELVQPNAARATISPDGRSLIFFKQEGDPAEKLTLWEAEPPPAEPRKLDVEFDKPDLTDALVRFAPDGSKLLVWAYGYVPAPDQDRRDAFWLIPWPGGVPRNALPLGRRKRDATIAFDWLPDSRHVVLSLGDAQTPDRHLWLAATERERLEMLTMTPASESSPSVSPDGSRLAFTSEAVDFDLISIPNDGGPSKVLFATSRNEFDPAWAPGQPNFAFVTDRNGSLQLLVRSRDGFEREIVSDALFPDDHTWALGALAFSADGSRIAYQRLGERSGYRVWISTAVAAGPPVELSHVALGQGRQDAPTWSPDGLWIAYVYGESSAPRWRLVKTRVGGGGESIVLNDHVLPYTRPAWSPDGLSILFDSPDGLTVIDADGRNPRVVSDESWIAHEWAADARTIYGLREAEPRSHFMLVALDITTRRERVVNADLGVIPVANQPIRGLTRTETGAWVTSVARVRSDIYMLEGFSVPKGGLARLKGLFTRP